MTTIDTPTRSTVARLERENQRLRTELTELRKASRKQIRDLEHQVRGLPTIDRFDAAQAEIRHLRDELTALRLETDQA